MTNQEARVALVTGGNKGIGLEIIRGLAKAELRVYLAARNPELGQAAVQTLKAEGLEATFIELDFARPETAKVAAQALQTDAGRLDVLVNNAAIAGADGPPSTVSLDVMREVYETNVIGAVMVTQALLPLLRQSKAGRIVNITSDLGSVTNNNDPDWKYSWVTFLAYSASKAALNMFTVQLSKELRDTSITVDAVNPGFTATDLNGNRGTQTVEEGAAEAIRVALLNPGTPTANFFETGGTLPW